MICERVLRETDGAISLIRIIDRFTIQGSSPIFTPTTLTFWLAVLFRRGFPRGVMNLTVQPVSPSGKSLPAMTFPLHFEGDEEHGSDLALQVNLLAHEDGLYWFEIRLAEQLATRVPLRVVYLPTVSTTPGQGQESPKPR